MLLLRNILFDILFYLGSVVLVLLVAVGALFGRRATIIGSRTWSTYARILTRTVLGIRIVWDGRLPNEPVIVAAKHESFYEALLMPALFQAPSVIMKKELEKIPVWGWLVRRHGSIFVDRAAGSAAMRDILARGGAALADGRPIVIFPEGSRADPGEQPTLRPGVVGLYRLLKVPVVPVALHSAHVWPRKGLRRPGIVPIHIGEPIPPGLKRDEFEARLHTAINLLDVPA